MSKLETIRAVRFGYGLGPGVAPPKVSAIIDALGGRDSMAGRYPTASTRAALKLMVDLRDSRRAIDSGASDAQAQYEAAQKALRDAFGQTFRASVARVVDSPTPFRERLAWFWADHFTATAKTGVLRGAAGAYLDEAIRPHLAGRFGDMLKAVVTHPFMLAYLDQVASVGPNSRFGKRRGRGLNENLAREVLELHTLGVGGAYTQKDVRQLAELMTGLSIAPEKGFVFRAPAAEPGAETVLGKSYGGARGRLKDVMQAMEDIAVHPDTARHLAQKIAVHFVSETPDRALVAALETAYRQGDGALLPVYRVLLDHPAARSDRLEKAKSPFDFIASSLVALGFEGREVMAMKERDLRRFLFQPMAGMGQRFMSAPGPDGWPEEAAHWITPQGLATRISWSMAVAGKLAMRAGDPREFLDRTLGGLAGPNLRFAVAAAATSAEGVGLTLASAEFNRR